MNLSTAKVLVWRTVDTPFDYSYGIDMFFEIIDEKDPDNYRHARVDVDLSMNLKYFIPFGLTNLCRSDFSEEKLARTALMVGNKLLAKLAGENRERIGVESSNNGLQKI